MCGACGLGVLSKLVASRLRALVVLGLPVPEKRGVGREELGQSLGKLGGMGCVREGVCVWEDGRAAGRVCVGVGVGVSVCVRVCACVGGGGLRRTIEIGNGCVRVRG